MEGQWHVSAGGMGVYVSFRLGIFLSLFCLVIYMSIGMTSLALRFRFTRVARDQVMAPTYFSSSCCCCRFSILRSPLSCFSTSSIEGGSVASLGGEGWTSLPSCTGEGLMALASSIGEGVIAVSSFVGLACIARVMAAALLPSKSFRSFISSPKTARHLSCHRSL